MNNNKKKRKTTRRTYSSRKRQTRYKCIKCSQIYYSIFHFRNHVKENLSCRSDFCCNFCQFIGYNEVSFNTHLNLSQRCQFMYKQSKVATGILPDSFNESIVLPNSSINSRSFLMDVSQQDPSDRNQYDRTILTINEKSKKQKKLVTSQHQTDYTTYMNNSCTVAGINNNQVSSTLQLDNSCDFDTNSNVLFENIPSIFNKGMSKTMQGNHLSSNYSSSSKLDFNNGTNSDSDSDLSNQESEKGNAKQFNENNHPSSHSSSYSSSQQHGISSSLSPIDITKEQQILLKHYSSLTFTPHDHILIDLFQTLKASNTPMIVFDRIINWVRRHDHNLKRVDATNLSTCDMFITDMNRRLYQDTIFMKPKVNPTTLSSGRSTNIITFSFKEMILNIVTNRSLFCSDNLLLDPDNPCAPPPETNYYGEVNTGTWYKQAIQNECKKPNHILMPFCHFIDGLKIDKYGKLSVEAVLTCCLWFNRKARNRSSTWFVQGFVQDQTLFHSQSTYVRDDKAQDYHDMMSKIFQEMKEIRDNGGMKLSLDFGNGKTHEVIAMPVIQFIIGDCKGNDLLCGRKGGHHIDMKGLCRDCNISPNDGDNVCLNKELMCKFHSTETIVGCSKTELDKYSFLPIRNCFTNLSFGGCPRNIYGATPAEMLHSILLGMCEYIAESMELIFTDSSMYLISKTVVGIYENSRRQSERDLPDMGPFQKGLFSVKSLKAKERFARLFCLFLALSNSYLIDKLIKKKKKKKGDNPAEPITLQFLREYKQVVEDTLLFYLWMKQEQFLKSDFEVKDGEIDSRAMKRLKMYLHMFKKYIHRSGHGLHTTKFHQMLHTIDTIQRHGAPINYDGSRGENFGKILIKDNAKLTNKQKDTLNFDIGRRVSEENIVNKASTVYFENTGTWPSEYCNEIDLMLGNEISIQNSTPLQKTNTHLHSYYIIAEIEKQQNPNNNTKDQIVNVDMEWRKEVDTPLLSYPVEILKKVAERLFLGRPSIGGKVDPKTKIPCYTHVYKDNTLYRAHPSFFKKGCWYDWAYFSFEEFEDPIAAQIMMIIDLRNVDILYSESLDESEENEQEGSPQHIVHHLSKQLWVVVLSSVTPKASHRHDLTNSHFDSSILTRIKLHDDKDVFLLPLESIYAPCFVVHNKNYVDSVGSNNAIDDDRTAYVVKPMNEWADEFLPQEM